MELKTYLSAMDFAHLKIVNDVLLNEPGLDHVRQYHAFCNRIIRVDEEKDVRIAKNAKEISWLNQVIDSCERDIKRLGGRV